MRLGDRLRRVLDAPTPTATSAAPEPIETPASHEPHSSSSDAPGHISRSSDISISKLSEPAISQPSEPSIFKSFPSPDLHHPTRLTHALERLDRSRRREPPPRADFLAHGIFQDGGPPPSLDEAIPGAARSTSRGSTWVSTLRTPLSDRHGHHPVSDALDTDVTHIERLTGDPRLAGFDLRRALFLDIEATGLEHGAGTLAFMLGLGHLEDDAFVTTQLILRDPDEEGALLELLWETLERFPYLVSFNGKSFDLSVLQNRLVMNRFCSPRESQLKLRPHLDLLHLGRNLYRGAYPDTRLQTLEQRVLGFCRESDMPGALAPACWFAWLRDADPRPLAGIAHHNHWDVLSMLALATRFSAVARPIADTSRPTAVTLNLANLYARRKCPEDALAVLSETSHLYSPEERETALTLEATCARRAGLHHRQAEALRALLNRRSDARLERALTRAERRAAVITRSA